jgi:Zinc finger, C2H2 type
MPLEDIKQEKQEPEDILNNCCLCSEGKNILELLANHFEKFHSGEFLSYLKLFLFNLKLFFKDVFQGSFTHFCNCFEGLKLQSNLINHLLSHVLGTTQRSYEKPQREFHSQLESTTVFASNLYTSHETSSQREIFETDVQVKNEPELIQEDSFPSSCNYESSEANEAVQYQSLYPKGRRKRTKRSVVADSYTYDEVSQKFSCNLCGRQYVAKYNVRKHLHEKHRHINSDVLEEIPLKAAADNGKRFYCSACPKDFSSKQGLEKHQNNEHNPSNLLKCNKCPASLSTLKLFHAHARTHELKQEEPLGDGATQCKKCFKTYSTPKQLYHHMLVHREKLLSCDKCGERFNFKVKLIHHLFRHVGIKYDKNKTAKERIVCEICSELVPKYNMKRHILMKHDKYRPFKCEQPGCDSAFSETRHLSEHMNIHMGLKPFICEFCSMGKLKINEIMKKLN